MKTENKNEKVEELTDNGKRDDDRGTDNSNSGSGNTGGGTRSGDNDGRGNGESKSDSGTSGTSTEGDTTSSKPDRDAAKQSIITNIRSKRNKRDNKIASNQYTDLERAISNRDGRHPGDNATNAVDNGDKPGDVGAVIGGSGTPRATSGDNDDNNESPSAGSGRNNRVNKAQGMDIKVPPFKPKAVPPLDVKASTEDTLTKKESSELLPRVVESLRIVFKYTDQGINFTTKDEQARNVYIWGSIDDDELKIIAIALVEGGQRSKVVATAVRQVSRNYQKLQMGIILVPRFVMTVNHYIQNGFGLPFGGKTQ